MKEEQTAAWIRIWTLMHHNLEQHPQHSYNQLAFCTQVELAELYKIVLRGKYNLTQCSLFAERQYIMFSGKGHQEPTLVQLSKQER